ncbi:unnamed protein product [Musa hybrid cultivar]
MELGTTTDGMNKLIEYGASLSLSLSLSTLTGYLMLCCRPQPTADDAFSRAARTEKRRRKVGSPGKWRRVPKAALRRGSWHFSFVEDSRRDATTSKLLPRSSNLLLRPSLSLQICCSASSPLLLHHKDSSPSRPPCEPWAPRRSSSS